MRECPTCGYQLLPFERECPKCRGGARPTAAAPKPEGPAPTSGWAIAALVLGILSLCGGLTAVPGLIVGGVAVSKINRSMGRLGGKVPAWVGIGLASFGVVANLTLMAILYPVFAPSREAARTATCLSNVRQLTLFVLMYAQDHEEVLPPADTWTDAVLPHAKTEAIFVCPTAKERRSGYAFNRALSERPLAQIPDPARTVMIFESDLGWNGAGGPEAVVSPPRHSGKVVIGFADGHVESVEAAEAAGFIWHLPPPGGQ